MIQPIQAYSQPKITMMKSHTAPMSRGQQISFGDSELPGHYDMDDAVKSLAWDKEYKIKGKDYQEAFSNYFDDVAAKLKSVKNQDILNRANKAMENKLLDVDLEMKLPKDEFVDNMSKFMKTFSTTLKKQEGLSPFIEPFLVTQGYKAPKKGLFGISFDFSDDASKFRWMKGFMKDVCDKFIDKGKIALKNIV